MKRLRSSLLVFILLILIVSGVFIWILRINGIGVFNREKPKYVPLVSKDDNKTSEFEEGLEIFLNDCNKCHVTKDRLHNYLDGVVDRLGESYLKLYITRQDSLIENEDKLALVIKREWGNNANSHNFEYSAEELNCLIEYLK